MVFGVVFPIDPIKHQVSRLVQNAISTFFPALIGVDEGFGILISINLDLEILHGLNDHEYLAFLLFPLFDLIYCQHIDYLKLIEVVLIPVATAIKVTGSDASNRLHNQ